MMISANVNNATEANSTIAVANTPEKVRQSSQGKDPLIFADIYQEDVNIVTWQRNLPKSLIDSVGEFLAEKPEFQASATITPQNASSGVRQALGPIDQAELVENITELVGVFCDLFELSYTGLRLTALRRAMCPKFHVDRVPCRLVSTYQGIATEWLPHHAVDRSKLGMGSDGLPDSESGLYQHQDDIQQLNSGDVALLKGESWHNNVNAGLVHRSPALSAGENRLLLTLDFLG